MSECMLACRGLCVGPSKDQGVVSKIFISWFSWLLGIGFCSIDFSKKLRVLFSKFHSVLLAVSVVLVAAPCLEVA